MDEVRIFLSYARQQLYFAESLALNLQASGIPVWMDIQQLEPGSDWAEGIAEGLKGCTALLLLASRAALKSPHVREEWTAALEAGKPIYVAFFEALQLPAVLRDSPQVSYFNFRRDFDRKVRQLSDCLKEAKTHRDSIDTRRFIFPPAAHWAVVASLLLPSLILLTWLVAIFLPGFIYFPESFDNHFLQEAVASANLVITWVYVIAFGFTAAGGFLWRRFAYLTLRIAPWVLVVLLWFAYRSLDPVTHGQSVFRVAYDEIPLYSDSFIIVALGLTGLALASFLLQRKSADILRWMPLGQAPAKMRQAINTRLLRSRDSSLDKPVSWPGGTYQIYYDPADQYVAEEVQERLHYCDYRRVDASSAQPATMAVFILSNYSDLETLKKAAGELPRRAMAVVATSIRIPDSPQELFRFQWVDYRRRTPEQLDRIEDFLRGKGLSVIENSFAVDPESMEKVVVPTGIFFVTNSLRSLGALALGAGLYLLVLLALDRGGSWRGVLMLALGAAMFWLAGRLTERRIRPEQFAAGYGILLVALFVLNVSGVLWVLLRNYGANTYTGEPTIFGYAYLAVLLLTPPAVAFYYRELIERWLPPTGRSKAPSASLQISAPRMSWFAYSLGVLLLTVALLANTRF